MKRQGVFFYHKQRADDPIIQRIQTMLCEQPIDFYSGPLNQRLPAPADIVVFVATNAAVLSDSLSAQWHLAYKQHTPIITALVEELIFLPPGLSHRTADFTESLEHGFRALKRHFETVFRLQGNIALLHRQNQHLRESVVFHQDVTRVHQRVREIETDIAFHNNLLRDPGEVVRIVQETNHAALRAEYDTISRHRHHHTAIRERLDGVSTAQKNVYRWESYLLLNWLNSDEGPAILYAYGSREARAAAIAGLLDELSRGGTPFIAAYYQQIQADITCALSTLMKDTRPHDRRFARDDGISTQRLSHLFQQLQTLVTRPIVLIIDVSEMSSLAEQPDMETYARKVQAIFYEAGCEGRMIVIGASANQHPVLNLKAIPLDSDYTPEAAVETLRQWDFNGSLGLRDMPDAPLEQLVNTIGSHPRTLRAVLTLLHQCPLKSLDSLYNPLEQLYEDLSEGMRMVMQALAVYQRPVTATAIRFLLQPYVEPYGLDVLTLLDRLVYYRLVLHIPVHDTYLIHPVDAAYVYNLLSADPDDAFSIPVLERRAANYYLRQSIPPDQWQLAVDAEPQFAEFDHRMRAGDFDSAARLINTFDFDELLRWGFQERLLYMQQSVAGTIKDPQKAALHHNNTGLVLMRLGKYIQAQKAYASALDLYIELGDEYEAAITRSNLASLYSVQGSYRKAIALYRQSLQVFQRHTARSQEGLLLNLMGRTYYNLGDLQEAAHCYDRALEIARLLGDQRGEGERLHNLGMLYRDIGQIMQAMELFTVALQRTRELRDRVGESECLTSIGNLYAATGAHKLAYQYYQHARTIAQETGDRIAESDLLNRLGMLRLAEGDLSDAERYLQDALAMDQALGNLAGQGDRFGSLGDLHVLFGDYDKALWCQYRALDIARKTGRRSAEGVTLASLGLIHSELHQHRRAREYYKRALQISRETHDAYAECSHLINLGTIYADMGRHQDALSHIQQAYSLALAIDAPLNEAESLLAMGWVCLEMGHFDIVLFIVRDVSRMAHRLDYLGLREHHAYLLASLLVMRGKFHRAFAAASNALELARDQANPATQLSRYTLVAETALYLDDLEAAQCAIEAGLALETPVYRQRSSWLIKGHIYARMGQPETARCAYEKALALCDSGLETTPELFRLDYARGHALSGLAVLAEKETRTELSARAAQSFLIAKERCAEPGVLQAALLLFNTLSPLDPAGDLRPIQQILSP